MGNSTNPSHREYKKDWPKWRTELHNIIFEADTPAGRLFDIVLLILIALSILVVMLESVNSIDAKYHDTIIAIEWVLTIFFTLEYILRILAVKKPMKYVTSFYGVIDLLAILPTYLSIFFVGSKGFIVIRALRLMRIFRVLKLVRFSNASTTIKNALIASRYKIIVFMIFVVTLITLIGSLMYVIESPTNPGFDSIPKSIYWAIVTLTTVGFGDITPQTGLGQFLASVIMILGYGIIAVPTGIVTAEFSKGDTAEAKTISQSHDFKHMNYACISCGAENHQRGAKYCYKCGHDLSHNS